MLHCFVNLTDRLESSICNQAAIRLKLRSQEAFKAAHLTTYLHITHSTRIIAKNSAN